MANDVHRYALSSWVNCVVLRIKKWHKASQAADGSACIKSYTETHCMQFYRFFASSTVMQRN